MKQKPLNKLQQAGFTHLVLLVAFVAVFAIAGVGLLVASHANSQLPAATNVKLSSSNNGVLIDWDDNVAQSSKDFSYYAVRRSTTTNITTQPGWTRLPGNLTVSQTLDTTAKPGIKYYYYVVAFDKSKMPGARSQVITINGGSTTPSPTPTPTPKPTPTPTPTPAPNPVPGGDKSAFWTMDFNNKPLGTMKTGASEPWYGANTYRPERLSVVNDPLGKFGKVMKAYTVPGEYIGNDKGGKCDANGSCGTPPRLRAEAYYPTVNGKAWAAHPGDDLWYGWRFLIDGQQGCQGSSISQFKGMNPDSGTYGGFLSMDSTGVLRMRFGANKMWHSAATFNDIKGKWQDVVFHITYKSDNSGVIEFWYGPSGSAPQKQTFVDSADRSIGNVFHGPTVFAADRSQNNVSKDIMFKQGVYRTGCLDRPVSQYYSMTRIGHSYNAVVPR